MSKKIKLTPNIIIAYGGKDPGNMSAKYGDAVEIEQNRQKLYGLVSASRQQLTNLATVYNNEVIDLRGAENLPESVVADSLIIDKTEHGITLFPADCIPLVLYDEEGTFLSLVHLGWRQLTAGVLDRTIALLNSPQTLKAFIGPAIGPQSYAFPSVTDEQLADPMWASHIRQEDDGLYHIDLKGYAVARLEALGVPGGNIQVEDIDVGADDVYFSNHRSNMTGDQNGRNGFVTYLKG